MRKYTFCIITGLKNESNCNSDCLGSLNIKSIVMPILISTFILLSVFTFPQDHVYKQAHVKMVKEQIEARGISDKKVLEAFRRVPRHRFVIADYLQHAYADSPLPIDEGQTISQPYIVAFMTDALKLQSTDRVLEIGTGSGYQAAILAQICDSVFTIELFQKLTNKSKSLFKELNYTNIYCKTGDGYKGWFEKAPFNAIIVTCSPSHVPQALQDQLAEGGRMIIPVGEVRVQQLVLLEKKKGKIRKKNVLPVRFVPMLKKDGEKY